jgi:hypothetical protein
MPEAMTDGQNEISPGWPQAFAPPHRYGRRLTADDL